ncbi:uncharacterized protein [Primulina huaijiensis]|uniref:uncharacterized protein n=1 Tax=Primulina huaijiensis TaxID=1492673 RepID=UPI003CC7191B
MLILLPSLRIRVPMMKREGFEMWEMSNYVCMMIMKMVIPEIFRGTMFSDVATNKAFFQDLKKRFAQSEKSEIGTFLANLISMMHKGKGNIREYIMEMFHPASRLKSLKFDLSEDLLMHLILISLPPLFNQFKVSYNCQKESWSLNELISYCV